MKIGMLAQWLSRANGGVSESVRLACAALVDVPGVEIVLFCADDANLDADFKAFPQVRLVRAKAYGPARYGFAPVMVNQLLAEDVDILHVHGIWTYHARAAWLWQRRSGRPLVVSPHGMLEKWIVQRSPLLKRIVWRTYLRDLFTRTAAIQILTEKERGDVESQLSGQDSNAFLAEIPNYVPPHQGTNEKPAWWRPDMAGKRVFLFLGRLHVKKGVEELCQAWSAFNRNDPDIARTAVLVLCGWNDGIPDFTNMVARAGLPLGNVLAPGPQYGEEKARCLSAADVMVLPSKSEGLPMALLEGFGAGLPALMTLECNLNVAFAAGAALPVRSEPASIHEGLATFAVMPEGQREKMAHAGIAMIAEQYSVQFFRERIMTVYEMVLAGRS